MWDQFGHQTHKHHMDYRVDIVSILTFSVQYTIQSTFSSRAFLYLLARIRLRLWDFCIRRSLQLSVYCLGWGITLHDIQIAGTTIYRIVKSQYKQVAGGGSQNAKAGIGPALHLAWYFRQLKFRGKWFSVRETIRLVLSLLSNIELLSVLLHNYWTPKPLRRFALHGNQLNWSEMHQWFSSVAKLSCASDSKDTRNPPHQSML